MVKKSFIQSIADKNAKVNTLCEYLGTLRTECIRTYQSVGAVNTHNFGAMHEIYTQISELSDKLNRLLSDYVLSDSTTRNKNYECARSLVLDVDKKGNHKGAFVEFINGALEANSKYYLFYSNSELSGYVTRMYNEYLNTLDSVRKERGKREKLADRKARLLAELAALEEEENK